MKNLGALALVFLVVVVILSLLTALTSASASLANSVANAAASTALLISQCLSGFMVVVALWSLLQWWVSLPTASYPSGMLASYHLRLPSLLPTHSFKFRTHSPMDIFRLVTNDCQRSIFQNRPRLTLRKAKMCSFAIGGREMKRFTNLPTHLHNLLILLELAMIVNALALSGCAGVTANSIAPPISAHQQPLPNRNLVFEFTLLQADRGLQAVDINLLGQAKEV